MKRNTRKLLTVLTAIVFVVSSAMLLRQLIQYREGQAVYDEAALLAQLPDLTTVERVSSSGGQGEESTAPYASELENMDFAALRQTNEDVLGWIVIPDTNLSYPLLQGEDNDYYLDHTWRKGRNSVGAIFMDCRSSRDLSDFHTVIYGHRMNNSSMFGQLHKYKDPSYWEAHPYVYIADDSGSYAYQIFSIYEADSISTYQMSFQNEGEKQEFINYCLSRTLVDTGVTPTVEDRVITLSTCTGNGHSTRWVVQAVLPLSESA